MNAVASRVRRIAATIVLATLYGTTVRLSRLLEARRSTAGRSGYVLVIGTFHNPNWFHAHVRPLARSGVGRVLLVCDEVVDALEGVQFECAPRWLQRLLTRAGAKLVWSARCAWRYRPDLCMGYHIFPCALIALTVARCCGRPASYQITAGPIELDGGGWHTENALLRALGGPSPVIARLAAAVLRQFDSVVVRGNGAATYVRALGYERELGVISGSVHPDGPWRDFEARTIDIGFVGRLTEYKRPDRFLAVVASVVAARPQTRAVLIGDGPDAAVLRAQVAERGLASNVEFLGQRGDVDRLLAMTKVFVLTSRWEGLSIAMLEAMAAGAVPVVANVGDLADAVSDGVNGFIVAEDDIGAYVRMTVRLLSDAGAWRACSAEATDYAMRRSGTDVIAQRWARHLGRVLDDRQGAQAASASGPMR